MNKGHVSDPVKSTEELRKEIKTNINVTLYCKGIFTVTEEMEDQLKEKI